MALITCPECKREVSDKAVSCPQCGAPIAGASETAAAGTALTTVQETSKRLKLHILISALLFCIGLIAFFTTAGAASAGDEPSQIPALMVFVGIVWYVVTRIRIWWHHK